MRKMLLAVLAAALVAGCATQKIDWSARVGIYTRDQAIMDFGPPDKSARLTDGTVVAEWLTRRGHVIVAPEPYFLGPGNYYGPFTPMYSESYVPDYFLRLTFDPAGKLKDWKQFNR